MTPNGFTQDSGFVNGNSDNDWFASYKLPDLKAGDVIYAIATADPGAVYFNIWQTGKYDEPFEVIEETRISYRIPVDGDYELDLAAYIGEQSEFRIRFSVNNPAVFEDD